jgi:hypothetical protein
MMVYLERINRVPKKANANDLSDVPIEDAKLRTTS